jgi:hypothetical protein
MLLYLDSNAFKGTFPSEFGSLTALTTLAFEKNAITGTLFVGTWFVNRTGR